MNLPEDENQRRLQDNQPRRQNEQIIEIPLSRQAKATVPIYLHYSNMEPQQIRETTDLKDYLDTKGIYCA